jgi:CHASE3 domain sensor protein
MWYLSSKQFYKQQERAQKALQEHIERLFTVIEDDKEYKELIAVILNRLELKIDIAIRDKK